MTVVATLLGVTQLAQIATDLMAQAQQYMAMAKIAGEEGRSFTIEEVEAYKAADDAAREWQIKAVQDRLLREGEETNPTG